MRISLSALALGLLAAVLTDAPVIAADQPELREIAGAPNPAQLQATVQGLVGFGTRHTPSQTVNGSRLPKPAEIVDVVAIQKGTSDPERVVVLTGHIDSRVTDVMNATADAPGADDDASGVAAVIEAARILSRYKFAATIVYGVLSGEEQGLYSGKVLAEYAKAQGWRVEADLNNDIVGGTRGQNGVVDNTRVRLFSEGTRDAETPADAKQRRFEGGENDCGRRDAEVPLFSSNSPLLAAAVARRFLARGYADTDQPCGVCCVDAGRRRGIVLDAAVTSLKCVLI